MSLRYLLRFVSRDLESIPHDVKHDCKKVIRFFAYSHKSIGSRITFSYLAHLLGKNDVNEIAQLVRYITSQRMPIMTVKFEYYRHPSAMPITLDDEDMIGIFTDGVFYDPDSGVAVESHEQKIVPYLILNRSIFKRFNIGGNC